MSVELKQLQADIESGAEDDVIAGVERFLAGLATDSFTVSAVLAPDATVDAAAIGGSFAGMALIIVLGAALVIVMACNIVKRAMKGYIHGIPTFGGEGKIDALIDLVFRPIEWLHNKITDWMTSVYKNWAHDVVHFFQFMTLQAFPFLTGVPSSVQNTNLKPLYQRLAYQEGQIQKLQDDVRKLQHQTGTANVTPSPTSISLETRVKVLEHNYPQIYNNQVMLWNDLNKNASLEQDDARRIQKLESGLGQVRATQVTWPDVETALNNNVKPLEAEITRQGQQVTTNAQNIAHMSPLTLLLQPGMPGLRNLRKLEDDPCQCPQPRRLSIPDIETLALIEFAENG